MNIKMVRILTQQGFKDLLNLGNKLLKTNKEDESQTKTDKDDDKRDRRITAKPEPEFQKERVLTIDLHFLSKNAALLALRRFMFFFVHKSQYKGQYKFEVVLGRGIHSKNGFSLYYLTKDYLDAVGYILFQDQKNPGLYQIVKK